MTGASGRLGQMMHSRLSEMFDLTLTDVIPPPDLYHVPIEIADLADADAVDALMAGVDTVVHLAGTSKEMSFAATKRANIDAVINLYESARRAGVKRVVFAGSHHVVGYYSTDEFVEVKDPVRPDSFYAVTKCFAEAMASLYFDKFGIETVMLRIGSCTEAPTDARMLRTWISPRDMTNLVIRSLLSADVSYKTVFAVSDNPGRLWALEDGRSLGWTPLDSTQGFDLSSEAAERPHYDEYHGGVFTTQVPPDSV